MFLHNLCYLCHSVNMCIHTFGDRISETSSQERPEKTSLWKYPHNEKWFKMNTYCEKIDCKVRLGYSTIHPSCTLIKHIWTCSRSSSSLEKLLEAVQEPNSKNKDLKDAFHSKCNAKWIHRVFCHLKGTVQPKIKICCKFTRPQAIQNAGFVCGIVKIFSLNHGTLINKMQISSSCHFESQKSIYRQQKMNSLGFWRKI